MDKQQKEMLADMVENIKVISDAAKKLLGSKLSNKALFVLLAHSTGLPQNTIRAVLDAAANLESEYLKK